MDEDDIWESSSMHSADGAALPQQHASIEWARLSDRFSDEGYREGITAGKLSTLQSGFDAGFALAAPYGASLGRLRGFASSLLSFLTTTSSPPNQDLIISLRNLIQDLARLTPASLLPPDLEAEAHAREHEAAELEDARQTGVRSLVGFSEELGGERGKEREMEELVARMEGVGSEGGREDGRVVLGRMWDKLRGLMRETGTEVDLDLGKP